MPTSDTQHLAGDLVTIERENRDLEVEIFVRRTMRVRVARDDTHEGGSRHSGTEEGVAVRVIDRRRRTLGFAATTGCAIESIRWAVQKAKHCMRQAAGAGLPEANGSPVPQRDTDEEVTLPQPEALESFLDASIDGMRQMVPRTLELRFPKGWVETGITEESIVSTAGVRAARYRVRSWSMLALRWKSEGGWYERPVFRACRGITGRSMPEPDRLDSLAFTGREIEPAAGEHLLFRPGAAAVLVRALARTGQGGEMSREMEVGPAWHLSDIPDLEGGLFGGSFDDTGAPAVEVPLADGLRKVGTLHHDGYLWRASYRDPPSTVPSNLVVRERSDGLPERCIALSDLRIHPLDAGRWVLEALGMELKDGEPTGRGGRCTLPVEPCELMQRCAGATGPAFLSHNGVTTPALILGVKS